MGVVIRGSVRNLIVISSADIVISGVVLGIRTYVRGAVLGISSSVPNLIVISGAAIVIRGDGCRY